MLNSAWEISSNDSERAYFLGRALLESGQVKESLEFLLDLANQHPDFEQTLYFLSEAYGKSGDLANAHYYLAQYEEQEKKLEKGLVFITKKPWKKPRMNPGKKTSPFAWTSSKKKGRPEKNGRPKKSTGLSPADFGYFRSKWENCMVKVPLPWVAERNEVE